MPCRNCSCPSCLALAGLPIPPTDLPPPPFELMTTNRAATDSEVAHSRDVIESAEKKISLIQAAMADLAEQTKDIFHFIETHRAPVSPLKVFPPELLVAIFTEYVKIVTDPWITPAPPEPPLNLMWICSRWRGIVLDTPHLWTKISSSTPMVNFWVDRSKELPLDLKLDLSLDDMSVLDALIPQAHRWERVDFVLQSNSNSILSPVKGRLRSLKSWKVSSDEIIGYLDFCEEAPQLTEIWLGNILNIAAVMLPWEQLRDCTLPTSIATLYALEHAKNMQTCRLDMCPPVWGVALEPLLQPCSTSLNTLIIYWRPEDHAAWFFSSLTFLSLQNLEIRFLPALRRPWSTNTEPSSELGAELLRFFERSSSHLAVLILDELPVSTTQVTDYLALMPSLTSLDIGYARGEYECVIEDDFIQSLIMNHANRLLPRLGALSLRGYATLSEECLDALVVSRRDRDAGISLLAKLVLDCSVPYEHSHSEPPSFHRFVSEGLDITYGSQWDIGDPTMDVIGKDRTNCSRSAGAGF